MSSHLSTHRAPATVLPLVGSVLHAGRHQAVATQQVPLQPLVGEEPKLTLLTIQGRPVVDHLGMNFDLEMVISMDTLYVLTLLLYLVYPLHVVP